MVCVNENSKKVLDKIFELVREGKGYLKLNNDESYIPLTVENIEENVLSLCHYGELNGDLMRDPEMLFWKDSKGDYYPYYFRNDYMGVEHILGEIENKTLVINNPKRQADQAEFSNIWLQNIKEQQELEI